MSQVISHQSLLRLIDDKLASGAKVYGPRAVRRGAPAVRRGAPAVRRGSPDPAEAADRRSPAEAGDSPPAEWHGQETGHSERQETGHSERQETGHSERQETGHNEREETGHSGLCLYQQIQSSAELIWNAAVRPDNSIKEVVFPRHERLFAYQYHGKQIELTAQTPWAGEQIVVGCRPCDAASLPILDHVFHWDYNDPFYDARRRQTTVVSLACQQHDAHCFCTSVGLGPDNPRGSDAMLFDLGNGSYEIRCLTDKGRALFADRTLESSAVGQAGPGPEKQLDLEAIGRFLEGGFENTEWPSLSRRCLGCGACAYNCPTCHCFDMVDEGNASAGHRVRNWDACQFAMFTMHASGHNPRAGQSQRQRQRILHKFRVYPEKFGDLLCTGCGNCTRNCPVRLGVRPVLEGIQKLEGTNVESK